jgi:hypothetical protein
MADARAIVVSDLLCYATKKFGRVALKPLKSVLNDFYSSDDICVAKDTLVEEVEKLSLDKWQKPARRRKDSITRTQNEIDDIMQVVTMLDETHNLDRLPMFVSSDPDCMPSIRLTDGDLAAVLLKLNALELNVTGLKDEIRAQALKAPVAAAPPRHVAFRSQTSATNSHGTVAPSTSYDAPAPAPPSYGLTTSDAGDSSENDDYEVKQSRKRAKKSDSPNQTLTPTSAPQQSKGSYASAVASTGPSVRNPTAKPKPKTVIGASSSSLLRASKTLIVKKSVFRLGNIDSLYSTTDVETYVRSLGVRILTCFELKQATSQALDNKAFRICVVADDKSKLCDSDNWSVGVSLREWVHKPKRDSSIPPGVTSGDLSDADDTASTSNGMHGVFDKNPMACNSSSIIDNSAVITNG